MYAAGTVDTTSAITGTVDVTNGSNAVAGSGTAFTTDLVVGDRIEINGQSFTVVTITDNSNMTVDANASSTAAGQTCYLRNSAWLVEKRLLSDGSLVTGFGTGGRVASADIGDGPGVWMDIDSTYMYLVSVEQVTPPGDYGLRIEKRSLSDGSLDTGFGTSGVVQQNLSTLYADGGLGVLVMGSYLYVSGAYDLNMVGPGNAVATIERRLISTGALDTSWATNGVFSDDTSSAGMDVGSCIATDGTDLYWLTKTETTTASHFNWRFVKVNIANPATTTAVTSTALIYSPTGPAVLGQIIIVGSHLYAFARNGTTDYEWRLEKRALSNLALDATFGTGGVYTSNPSDGTGGTGTYDGPYSLVEVGGVFFLAGIDEPTGGMDIGRRLEAIFR